MLLFTSPAIHFKVTEAEQPDDLKRLRSDLRARGLFHVFTPRERHYSRSGGFENERLGVNFRGKRRGKPPKFGGIFRQIRGGARHAYGYQNTCAGA